MLCFEMKQCGVYNVHTRFNTCTVIGKRIIGLIIFNNN